MTRREAAEYLRWKVDEVDVNLVPLSGHPAPVKGKMRYLLMDAEGVLRDGGGSGPTGRGRPARA